jgi:uncharacterized protein (TIGR03435 family)
MFARRRLTADVLLSASIVVGLIAASSAAQNERKFDVTSVKRNNSGDDGVSMTPTPTGIAWNNATLLMMMRQAYRVQDFQIVDGPSWLNTARFDVVAKADASVSQQDLRLMLRALLVERFRLAVHNETRQLPVYALVLARSDGKFGPQFRAPSDCVPPLQNQSTSPQINQRTNSPPQCDNKVLPGNMSSRGVTMLALTVNLSVFVGRTVIDRTGFTGMFDYDLRWTPDLPPQSRGTSPPGGSAADPNRPSLFTAVQEQLGLKLESTKGPVNVLIVDHVELPTPD